MDQAFQPDPSNAGGILTVIAGQLLSRIEHFQK
jgi:hypothetical protein